MPYALMALGYAAAWAAGRLLRKGRKSRIRHASRTHFLYLDWKNNSVVSAASIPLLGTFLLTLWIGLTSRREFLVVYLLGGMLVRAGHGWYLRWSTEKFSLAGKPLRR